MVSPRLNAIDELNRGLETQAARVSGLIQRGRLERFDELTGLGTVRVYLRPGQTATLRDILPLGDAETVADYVGFDVLLLAPSGRMFDGAYITGLASGPGILYDGFGRPLGGSVSAALKPTVLISPTEPFGALVVTSIEARLKAPSDSTVPIIRLEGTEYRARSLPEEARDPDLSNPNSWPVGVFRPVDEPFRMDNTVSFTATLSGDAGDWHAANASGPLEGFRLAVSIARPVLRLRGRLAVRLD